MSLDTTKSIKSITYNGTEIPLASTTSGNTSEIWMLNESVDVSKKFSYSINFTNCENPYNSISVSGNPSSTSSGVFYALLYGQTIILTSDKAGAFGPTWGEMRKLIFATAPTGDLLTWLQANAVKQEKNLTIQPSKSLTITSNGTTTITPDAPYDGIGQVGVTVNVPMTKWYDPI